MNVKVPFDTNPWGFWIVLFISIVAAVLSFVILDRKKMLK